MKEGERGKESDREMHSWLGFPYHSSRIVGKKVVIFGLGASVSHGGDTGGHCWEEQRLCLYPWRPSSLLSVFSSRTVWF